MAIIDHPCWYPLRVTYSRELKVRDILRNEGYECFVPMTVKDIVADGRKSRTYVPAVNNLCFVRAERQSLDEVLESRGMRQFTSYIWDRPTREPVVVRDKAMEDFIRVSQARFEDIVNLHDVDSRLRTGQKVKVRSGVFAGVEGTVVRVKRSRRVMVERPGMLAVATGYIPPYNLEIL